jgi:hypothetical protein
VPAKPTCAMCGDRFDAKRDSRRWKAQATPVPAAGAKPKSLIVCTDCFLELAEAEHGA